MDKQDDIARYRKKKDSNTSKSNKKAKHKHDYFEALISYNDIAGENYHRANICRICGKLGLVHFFETENVPGIGNRVMLDNSRLLEKYSHLKIYTCDKTTSSYIDDISKL